jgi:hypothetical protein
MPEPVRISIRKIVLDSRYQPRFMMNRQRVEQFRQSLRDGEHIPPILVGKEGEHYVVIEGFHRVTALKQEGVEEVNAFFQPESEKEFWLLDAARMNDKTTDPLTTEEVQEAIRRTWKRGIRDTQKIAYRVGRHIKFVRRALKPLRDEERKKRDAIMSQLEREGRTHQEIASEVGLTRQAVTKNLMQLKDRVSFSCQTEKSSDSKELDLTHEVNTFPEMLTPNGLDPPGHCNQSSGISTHQCLDSPQDDRSEKAESKKTVPLLDPCQDNTQREIAESDALVPGILAYEKSDVVDQEGAAPGDSQGAPEDTKSFVSCLGQIKSFQDLPPQKKHALQVMELVKRCKTDIVDMIDRVPESVIWMRKVMVAAISLALIGGKKGGLCEISKTGSSFCQISRELELTPALIETIRKGTDFKAMMGPIDQQMPEWIEENLGEADLSLIASLAKVPKEHIPYLIAGEQPPKQPSSHFDELPPKYAEELHAVTLLLRNIRDNIKKFTVASGGQLLKEINKIRIAVNEVYDGMKAERLI